MTGEQLIAGHRVLRLLATGGRSRVWLAPGDRVLKVLPSAAIGSAEAEALHRARGPHVVELLDVAHDDDGTVLVFPRLPRGSLQQLLAARAGVDAGEAVTALAPVAQSLGRMHRAGTAHGAVSAECVLFRDDGAPTLVGFGGASLFEAGLPEIALEQVEAVIDDRRGLLSLVLTVLARVSGPRSSAAADLAARLRVSGLQDLESRVAAQLFELAAARPLRFAQDERPSSIARAVDVTEVAEPSAADPAVHPLIERVVGAPVIERLLESGPTQLVRSSAARVWQGWSPRRRRGAIAIGAAAVALMIAVAVIPSVPPEAPSATAVQPEETAVEPTAEPIVPTEVTGDDPLAALPALLDRRTQCFRDLSVLCFDDVDEQASSALESDRAALDALMDAGEQPVLVDADGAALVERLGDSAIVALRPGTQPASLLLLKGEAGWRIRDYIAGPED